MDKVNELFSAPVGLEPAYKLGNVVFYSSNKLKEKFILAFLKSSKGKHIASEVEKLVENNIIIPCFKSKNLLSFIKNKLTKENKYIAAFYAIEDKKVVVIIDSSISIFGTSSNVELTSTTMHECMHLSAGRNLSKFLQIFTPNLVNYYSEFYKDFLYLEKVDIKKIKEVIKFMVPFEKRGAIYANRKLNDYYRLIYSLFINDSKLNDKLFQERLTNMIVACKLFIINYQSLLKNASSFAIVFRSLNKAYESAFGKRNTYTTPIQELINFSEVACVLSEMHSQDSSIKKLFQVIK